MAITTACSNDSGVVHVAVGNYIDTGTVAAFKVVCGFKPRYVRVINETAGFREEWYQGMANAEAFKMNKGGTAAMITTLGITPTAGGFIIGLDTDINVTSEQVSWLALG